MNDELDKLDDAKLSEVFAVEVADEKPEELAFASRDGGQSGALFEDSRYGHGGSCHREDVKEFCERYPEFKVHFRKHFRTNFATDANAVIPYFENVAAKIDKYYPSPQEIAWKVTCLGPIETSYSPTLARSACIALIRHKRSFLSLTKTG